MKNDFQEPQGINFRCEEYFPIEVLSASLCQVLSFLQADDPYIKLLRYDDWWQHDGLHFSRGAMDFHILFQIAGTPRSLYEAMPGDDEVRIGIAPDHFRWYLRMFADWDADDKKLEGDFDITLSKKLANRFRKEVVPNLSFSLIEESAETYYKRIKE